LTDRIKRIFCTNSKKGRNTMRPFLIEHEIED
jgi:hypothetical protein